MIGSVLRSAGLGGAMFTAPSQLVDPAGRPPLW
jgi:hypothetical protein